MLKAKTRADWEHTSALAATILNSSRVDGNIIPLDFLVPKFSDTDAETATDKKTGREIITDAETKRAIARMLKGRL
ncbi:MAG: hypothetical protein Q4C70_08590 [Planctomycetia bacterium]|nr:hypothetical protein [Planctomycetia bacterium]